jgi:hypothetical protein
MARESLVSDIPAGDGKTANLFYNEQNAFLPFKNRKTNDNMYLQAVVHSLLFYVFCRGFRATQATGPTPITIRNSEFMYVILLPTKTEFLIDFSNNK